MNRVLVRREGASVTPRILVVVRWPVGGIRTWCRYVYRDREFERFNITMLVPDGSEARTLSEDLRGSAINVVLAETGDSTRRFMLLAIRQILRGNYDLVHSHGFTSAIASSIACRLAQARHLVTPHDVVLDNQYRNLQGRISRLLVALALDLADRVQAVGAASRDNLCQAFPRVFKDSRKLLVVRNGIDTTRFLTAVKQELRRQYDIPRDAIIVGFFGRFMAQKGFQYLVQAIRQHRDRPDIDIPLVVLAVGSGRFQREEQESIQSLGISDAFRFTEFSPDIAGLLKSVDVVAMPSLWEACPLLPMEALTAGVPIVVSDFNACVEIVAGSPAKVVPMRDSASLLNAILELASPASKAAAMSYMETAAARFDVARTRQGIIELYDSLIGPLANRAASALEGP